MNKGGQKRFILVRSKGGELHHAAPSKAFIPSYILRISTSMNDVGGRDMLQSGPTGQLSVRSFKRPFLSMLRREG